MKKALGSILLLLPSLLLSAPEISEETWSDPDALTQAYREDGIDPATGVTAQFAILARLVTWERNFRTGLEPRYPTPHKRKEYLQIATLGLIDFPNSIQGRPLLDVAQLAVYLLGTVVDWDSISFGEEPSNDLERIAYAFKGIDSFTPGELDNALGFAQLHGNRGTLRHYLLYLLNRRSRAGFREICEIVEQGLSSTSDRDILSYPDSAIQVPLSKVSIESEEVVAAKWHSLVPLRRGIQPDPSLLQTALRTALSPREPARVQEAALEYVQWAVRLQPDLATNSIFEFLNTTSIAPERIRAAAALFDLAAVEIVDSFLKAFPANKDPIRTANIVLGVGDFLRTHQSVLTASNFLILVKMTEALSQIEKPSRQLSQLIDEITALFMHLLINSLSRETRRVTLHAPETGATNEFIVNHFHATGALGAAAMWALLETQKISDCLRPVLAQRFLQ